jgi:integral membrane protein
MKLSWKQSLSHPLGRFRLLGIIEGISFLVLLGIAMPLKYRFGIPEAVRYTGWLHGALFVGYLWMLMHIAILRDWSIWRVLTAFFAAVIPFGPFLLDARLKQEQIAEQNQAS